MKAKMALVLAVAVLTLSPAWGLAQPAPAAIRTDHDLTYGKGGEEELKLDLAMPSEGEGPFPALVCIHGGGWSSGSRQDFAGTIENLARRGYVAVTISYRLAPQAKFPAQIEDCKAAVRWLRANATTYHVNPDRIGALGYSAGAHLACLLGVTDKDDGLEGTGGNPEQSSRVQAVVSFFGPTDFITKAWSDDLEKTVLIPFIGAPYAERPELYKKASPLSYVTQDDPPFLFFHGTADKSVSIRHSRVLVAKLKEAGVEATLVELEGEDHGWRNPKLAETIAQAIKFFDEHLKK